MYLLRMVPNRHGLFAAASFVKLSDAIVTHIVVDIS